MRLVQKWIVFAVLIWHCRNVSYLFDGNNNTFPDRLPLNGSEPAIKMSEIVRVPSSCIPYQQFIGSRFLDKSNYADFLDRVYAGQVVTSEATLTPAARTLPNFLVSDYKLSTGSVPRILTTTTITSDSQSYIPVASVSLATANPPQSQPTYSSASVRATTTEAVATPLPSTVVSASSEMLNEQNSYIPTIPSDGLSSQTISSNDNLVVDSNNIRVPTGTSYYFLSSSSRKLADPPPIQISYRAYAQAFGKPIRNFGDSKVSNYRELIFNENVKLINEHNRNKSRTYNMGLNQFSDLDAQQEKQLFSGFQPISVNSGFGGNLRVVETRRAPAPPSLKMSKPPDAPINRMSANYVANKVTEPDAWHIDWRCVANFQVYNIGECGACSFFSSIDALYISLRIWGYSPQPYSVQSSISCVTSTPEYICKNGVNFIYVYEYVRKYGTGTEYGYPYTDKFNKVDASKCDNIKLKSSSYRKKLLFTKQTYLIEQNDCKEVVNQLRTRALTVAIISNSDFIKYSSGTFNYDLSLGESTNHAVVLMGYNPTDGYLIKNVWGTTWGMNGYGYLSQDSGVCSWAVYAKDLYQLQN